MVRKLHFLLLLEAVASLCLMIGMNQKVLISHQPPHPGIGVFLLPFGFSMYAYGSDLQLLIPLCEGMQEITPREPTGPDTQVAGRWEECMFSQDQIDSAEEETFPEEKQLEEARSGRIKGQDGEGKGSLLVLRKEDMC